MNDLNRIDSHKLMFHPKEVANWLEGKSTYPIYVEVSPSGKCNHRCTFCFIDYMGYKGDNLDKDTLLKFMQELKELGLKSVMFGGEGEPLIHPHLVEITRKVKTSSVDVALTTNGSLFKPEQSYQMLPYLSWVKFSLDAADSNTYSIVHGCKEDCFGTTIYNIEQTVSAKVDLKAKCTIGVQFLLIPENSHQVREAAFLVKRLGADYFVVKPFTPQLKSGNMIDIDYSKYSSNIDDLSDNKFSVIFRKNTMAKQLIKKPYSRCLGYNFWSYLSSNGDVYPCSAFLGNKKFVYGNIYENSAYEIYNGEQKKYVDNLMTKIDVSKCRRLCRLDEINCYLWELKHPNQHVNFI